MDWAKLSTMVGLIGALAGALLTVPDLLPASVSAGIMAVSLVAAGVGRRLVQLQTRALPAGLLESRWLAWVLIAVSAATVLAGQAELIGDKPAQISAAIVALGLAFARSIFNWQETGGDGGSPPDSPPV